MATGRVGSFEVTGRASGLGDGARMCDRRAFSVGTERIYEKRLCGSKTTHGITGQVSLYMGMTLGLPGAVRESCYYRSEARQVIDWRWRLFLPVCLLWAAFLLAAESEKGHARKMLHLVFPEARGVDARTSSLAHPTPESTRPRESGNLVRKLPSSAPI